MVLHLAGSAASWALSIYFLLLVARWAADLAFSFEPRLRPRGRVALPLEAVYTATDPPLRFLRRYIPPLRFRRVSFDLGFLILFIAIGVLQGYVERLG